MRKFSQINESTTDHTDPYTWDELLSRIESGETKLQKDTYSSEEEVKEDTIKSIKRYLDMNLKKFPDIYTSPISTRIVDGIDNLGNYVAIFDEKGAPVALITEYDMMNPFVFDNIVIVPGRDSITCYNKLTGEFKRARIR